MSAISAKSCCVCHFGHIGNTISPLEKGPSHGENTFLVAHDQWWIALGSRNCSSGLAGVMQLTMCTTLPHFAFSAVLCPVA